MTTVISPITGAIVHNEPAFVDIRAWRGDDLLLPMTFMDNAKEVTDGVTNVSTGVLTSVSGQWVSGDVGSAIVGDKIPFGATIGTYNSVSSITLAGGVHATGTKTHDARFRWGPALDQSSATFSAQVRAHPDSLKIEASFTINAADAASGRITATIPTGTMRGLTAGRHFWDFQRVLAGVERTFFAGAFIVLGDTTRP